MQFSRVLLKVKYAICKQDPDEINLSKWRNYGKIKASISTFLNIVLRSRLMVADNTRDLSLFLCLKSNRVGSDIDHQIRDLILLES